MKDEIIRFVNASLTKLPEAPGNTVYTSTPEYESTITWANDNSFTIHLRTHEIDANPVLQEKK